MGVDLYRLDLRVDALTDKVDHAIVVIKELCETLNERCNVNTKGLQEFATIMEDSLTLIKHSFDDVKDRISNLESQQLNLKK
jgi:hypothetical protein